MTEQNTTPTQNISNMEEEEISLTVLIEALKKGIGWIILFATLFTALTIAYVLYVTPTYESSLKVLVSPIQSSSSMSNLLSMASSSEKITTEVSLATSDTSLKNALATLDLKNYFDGKGVCFADMKEETFSAKNLNKMVEITQMKDTRELEIKVTSTSPQFAADYANALGNSFRDLLSIIARESRTTQRQTIEEQIPINEKSVSEAREKLNEFMNENETSQMKVKETILTNQIAFIQLQKDPFALQFKASSNTLQEASDNMEASGLQAPDMEEIKKNAAVAAILTDYRASFKEAMLYQTVNTGTATTTNNAVTPTATATSRTYVLSNTLDEKKKELINSITKAVAPAGYSIPQQRALGQFASALADYLTLEAKMETLAVIEESYNEQLATYLAIESELAELTSNVTIYETLVLSLKQMLEETRILEASATGNVTVIDPAEVPEKHVKPQRTKTVAIGFLGGCFLGYALSLLLILLDTTAKTEDDVKKVLGMGVPSLGWIPYKSHIDKKSETPSLFAVNDNSSYVAERYRILCNNIIYSSPEKLQTIVFTSSDMSEGKTTATVNAAITFALLGKKVLIIEGDFRYSVLEKNFNLKHSKVGIADVIVKHVPVKNCIVRPLESVPTLHFLPQGFSSANPNIIYNSKEFKDMLEELKGIYDYIFVDCPPISYGSDFSILAKMIDGYVYIARAGISSREMIEDAKRSFPFIPAPLLGFVLYGVVVGNSSYGYSSSYSGKSYSYGYGDKKENFKSKKSYRSIHKEELKKRNKGRTFGKNEPVLAFAGGSDGFTGAKSKEQSFFDDMEFDATETKKANADNSGLNDLTDDFLSAIESDAGAKGGTSK